MTTHRFAVLLAALAACAPAAPVAPTPRSPPAASSAPAESPATPAEPMPAPRAGQDILGQNAIAALPERWIGTPVPVGAADGPRATLLRFWTDTCPYCEASLPALETLRNEFADEGLVVVGIYHPKPPRAVTDEDVTRAALERSFRGPLAIDESWTSLRRIWLDSGRRQATSASFLLDATGAIRFVHPGPELHPSDDSEHATCDADYNALRQAIVAVLAQG